MSISLRQLDHRTQARWPSNGCIGLGPPPPTTMSAEQLLRVAPRTPPRMRANGPKNSRNGPCTRAIWRQLDGKSPAPMAKARDVRSRPTASSACGRAPYSWPGRRCASMSGGYDRIGYNKAAGRPGSCPQRKQLEISRRSHVRPTRCPRSTPGHGRRGCWKHSNRIDAHQMWNRRTPLPNFCSIHSFSCISAFEDRRVPFP